MNFIKSIFQSRLLGAALMAAPMLGGLTGCGVFDESLDPCPQGVELRFVYDYNMEFANAFPSQVDCLTLLVYDANGQLVTTRTETSDVLADEDYRMTLDLPEGKYSFIAYGGMSCSDADFRYVDNPVEGSQLTSLKVELDPRYVDADPGTDLHPLFYGYLDASVPAAGPDTDYVRHTLYMMKDTNNLRIILQQSNGQPINDKDFKFYVTSDNTLMNWDNNIIPVSNATYNPWTRGTTEEVHWENEGDYTSEAPLGVNAAYAEFSFGRLVLGNRLTSRLVILNAANDDVIIDIPIIEYLLLLKSDHFASMGAQEFLDRESRWSMLFFLDKNHAWIKTHIVVNNWVVRINNAIL